MTADPTFGRLLPIPKKMAIVFGTESVGCSDTMLAAADKVRQGESDRERATRGKSAMYYSVYGATHMYT